MKEHGETLGEEEMYNKTWERKRRTTIERGNVALGVHRSVEISLKMKVGLMGEKSLRKMSEGQGNQ